MRLAVRITRKTFLENRSEQKLFEARMQLEADNIMCMCMAGRPDLSHIQMIMEIEEYTEADAGERNIKGRKTKEMEAA